MAKKQARSKVLNHNKVSHIISGWSGQVKGVKPVKTSTAEDKNVDIGGSPGQVKQPVVEKVSEINIGSKQPVKESATIQPEAITEKIPVIKQVVLEKVPIPKLKRFKKGNREVGYVVQSQDYLLYLEGFPSSRVNQMIVSQNGGRALVSALDEEKVEAWLLDGAYPKPGDVFTLSNEGLNIPLSAKLFGRTINPLGIAIDDQTPLPPIGHPVGMDVVAPGIDHREIITDQFYTGLTIIDTLLPIGRGQRELLFGEPRSGKAAFIQDVIIHQKQHNRICIYTAIGKSEAEVKSFSEVIKKEGAAGYTIIVAATSSESAPLIALAPIVSSAIAEYFRDQNRDVLLVFDDLATHSKYLREIALLAGRIPGRESYPADIFYQHSRLVERAGMFNERLSKGSITLLPVIETDIQNFTSLIPTNVMSMTDGHILFSSLLFAQGHYPAVEVDRSVTRVGRQTQIFIHKVLSDRVRSLLADFHELERFGRFGTELSASTLLILKRGKATEELIRQPQVTYIDPLVQILYLSLVFSGFFDNREISWVKANKATIIKTLSEHPEFTPLKQTLATTKLDDLIDTLKTKQGVLEAACQPKQNVTINQAVTGQT